MPYLGAIPSHACTNEKHIIIALSDLTVFLTPRVPGEKMSLF